MRRGFGIQEGKTGRKNVNSDRNARSKTNFSLPTDFRIQIAELVHFQANRDR